MLTRLKVDGFKNLVGVDVSFGPFTCVAGVNGVGKSNLFDAVRLLSALANQPLVEAALAVRDEGGRNTDLRGLLHRVGDRYAERMSFEAEMIVPPTAVDDFGQTAQATSTFLRYSLVLALRKEQDSRGSSANPLEILKEELVHIPQGAAAEHLLFEHDAKAWRRDVIHSTRRGPGFISTPEPKEAEGVRQILLHQDRGTGGRASRRPAAGLPRTVLSAANGAENPTALCARREMQSWRLLQLEPSALRQPDEFAASAHLTANGRHLAATLHRLAAHNDASQVYAQIANRLSELIGDLRGIRVDRDEKRELLTLMATMADKTEYPARALSDGTLRFLALAVLELDSEAPGLLCLEEPENGIHPDRVPAMLHLLQDIATDPEEPADETNPLRQVIVNTHSPSVVMAAADDSVLLAKTTLRQDDRGGFECLAFACLPGTWRAKPPCNCTVISKGDLLAYLNPVSRLIQENPLISGKWFGSSATPGRRRRVIDHPEFSFLLPAHP